MLVKYEKDDRQYLFNSFEEIKHKDKIIYLDCSNNNLKDINEIIRFKNLIELNCSHNLLTSLIEINIFTA